MEVRQPRNPKLTMTFYQDSLIFSCSLLICHIPYNFCLTERKKKKKIKPFDIYDIFDV